MRWMRWTWWSWWWRCTKAFRKRDWNRRAFKGHHSTVLRHVLRDTPMVEVMRINIIGKYWRFGRAFCGSTTTDATAETRCDDVAEGPIETQPMDRFP